MTWDDYAETVCRNTPSLKGVLQNIKDARIGTPIDKWTEDDLLDQLDDVDDKQRRAVVAALLAIKQGAASNRLQSISDCLRENWQSLTANDALFPSGEGEGEAPAIRKLRSGDDWAARWAFPPTPPDFESPESKNLLGAKIKKRPTTPDLPVDWDFIIRVCVYLSGSPHDLIEPLIEAATRQGSPIRSALPAQSETPVTSVLQLPALIGELEPKRQASITDALEASEPFLSSTVDLSGREPSEMWTRDCVSLPLCNSGGKDDSHLNQTRFHQIFGARYVQSRSDATQVRLLPRSENTTFEKEFVQALGINDVDPNADAFAFLMDIRNKLRRKKVHASAATIVHFESAEIVAPIVRPIGPDHESKTDEGKIDEVKMIPLNGRCASKDEVPAWASFSDKCEGNFAMWNSVEDGPPTEPDAPTQTRMRIWTQAIVAATLTDNPATLEAGHAKFSGAIQNRVAPRHFQKTAIPRALSGMSMIIASETGSGKTLIFVMAIFMNAFPQTAHACSTDDREGIRAVVAVPTLQLASQHRGLFQRVALALKGLKDDDQKATKHHPFWNDSRVILPQNEGNPRLGVAGTTGDREVYSKVNYHRSLIFVDTPMRIKKFGGPMPKLRVVAIDEIDAIYKLHDQFPALQAIIRGDGNPRVHSLQLICVSATISRSGFDDGVCRDPFIVSMKTLLAGRRHAAAFLSPNFLPKSIFHLIVDLTQVGDKAAMKLKWLQMLHERWGGAGNPGCLVFEPTHIKARDRAPQINDDSALRRCRALNRDLSVAEKATLFTDLISMKLEGCTGTDACGVGLDQPFQSTAFDENTGGNSGIFTPGNEAAYVHRSGRCGRQDNDLGIAVVFVSSPVRRLIALPQDFAMLADALLQEDEAGLNKLFRNLIEKQPDLRDRIGLSVVPACVCLHACVC